jgi:TPP-dependent indolepyruvate ferredoxin oxidoreductase alpha subunit
VGVIMKQEDYELQATLELPKFKAILAQQECLKKERERRSKRHTENKSFEKINKIYKHKI